MAQQARTLGAAELSRAADVINAALSEMTGATSPRLHLELMVARILVPASDNTQRGALARVERLERRIGIEGDGSLSAAPVRAAAPASGASTEPASTTPEPRAAAPASVESAVAVAPPARAAETPETPETASRVQATPVAPAATASTLATAAAAPRTTPISIQQVKDSWPEILDAVEKFKRTAWMVVFTAKPLELRNDKILVLSFPSQRDVDALKERSAPGEGVGDYLKKAFVHVLGFEPALMAKVEGTSAAPPAAAPQQSAPAPEASPAHVSASEPSTQPRSSN